MNSEELEQRIHELILEIRTEQNDKVDMAKSILIKLGDEAGIRKVHSHLESIIEDEVLTVQWEIQDVLEELIPPTVKEEEDEEEDDPTKRPLRESELQMMAQVPQQGLVLFKSKVDTRWMLMQIDPYTGQLMGKQELDNEKGEQIYSQMNQTPRF
jgi:hypothetical protein